MGKYMHLFETQAEFESAYTGDNYNEPWVSYTIENEETRYNKSEREKLLETPLTFKIISGGTINWVASVDTYTKTIEYKKNDGEWTEITSNTGSSAPTISVASGDIVQFRGDNATYHHSSGYHNCFSGATCGFILEGNIMSLINSTGFSTATTLESDFTFVAMFLNCTGLTNASRLILPAITLTQQCYNVMFQGCTSLTTAPELPAVTMRTSCYSAMFMGCTSLVAAPELPAATLAYYCYAYMFEGCTGLTTAPSILPATTLASNCYFHMFYNCANLTSAPELPAATLLDSSYNRMFYGCTNLNYIKCLATDISAGDSTFYWVNGVASSGIFEKAASMTGWTTGVNGIPNNWTVQDAS